jgi:hypothetical protein|tara:strand:- start:282 stop:467 length:186 start_codon:yes stop_codon:yes gene_type:complete
MSKQINKVSKDDCLEAIEYLFCQAYVNDMTSDQRYYTKILLKKVANNYNMKLEDIDTLEGW